MGNDDARALAGSICLKRAYDAPAAADGTRVLVDRLWTRGVAKSAARLDAWMADLGPSNGLRTWFGHRSERWPAFAARYQSELATPMRQTLLAALQGIPGRSTLTLVYGARDETENEAAVLRQYLLRNRPTPAWDPPSTLLVITAVAAAARHDAVAPEPTVDLFATPLLPAGELASARSTLLANGHMTAVQGGWALTPAAQKQVRQLAVQRAPDHASP